MRFCIAGAGGRMGRMLIEAVLGSAGDRLVGALDAPGSAATPPRIKAMSAAASATSMGLRP